MKNRYCVSSVARSILALFSLFCAVSFTAVVIAMPAAFEPQGISGYIALILFPLFCLAITAVCFPGPLRLAAARFLSACVFALSIGYVISEIGEPLPRLSSYRRSDTNLINALLFFAVFGLPAARYLFSGKFSQTFTHQTTKKKARKSRHDNFPS
jgi:hypothetical protein